MAKPEWGTKRICQSCGVKFYDLGRQSLDCPGCGAAFDSELGGRGKRGRGRGAGDAEKKAPRSVDKELGDINTQENQSSPIENADELGEDDGVGEVQREKGEES